MQNKSKEIIFLGILFIFAGLFCIGSINFFYMGNASNRVIPLIDNAVTASLKEMKVLEAEKEQAKLRASGKLEQFNKEYNDFKQEYMRLAEEYKAKLPRIDQFFFIIYLLAGISSLIAGVGLIIHRSWGRYVSYLSIFSFGFSYILTWYAIYPVIFLINFLNDRSNALNLLIDPIDPAYKVLSKYAGQSTMKQMLFDYPFIIGHLVVIAVITLTLFYLSRPKVKAFLK